MIERYTQRLAATRGEDATGDGDLAMDLGSFGWLRGIRDRALMLELRKKSGHVMAIGYGWIERVEYEPERGITLHLPGREIRILGSRLNHEIRAAVRLLDGIVRHKVPWVAESVRGEAMVQDGTHLVIDGIEWTD